jgi:hypothetical protein
MFCSQALNSIHSFSPEQLTSLSDILSPELISECLEKKRTVTVRKRRLPLELMVLNVIGMALFRHIPMNQIINQLDIMLPGDRPFAEPGVFFQARQRLGIDAVREVFEQTQSLWNEHTPHPNWCGLALMV